MLRTVLISLRRVVPGFSPLPGSQDQSARPRALGAIGPRLAASAKSFKSARMSVPMRSIIRRYQAGSLFGFALKTAKALGLGRWSQGNAEQQSTHRTQSRANVSPALEIEGNGHTSGELRAVVESEWSGVAKLPSPTAQRGKRVSRVTIGCWQSRRVRTLHLARGIMLRRRRRRPRPGRFGKSAIRHEPVSEALHAQ